MISNAKVINVAPPDPVTIWLIIFVEEIFLTNTIQSVANENPKIKEFMYNLRQRPQVLPSPYLKEFEELITGLIFFVCITDNSNPFTCEGIPNV